MSVRLVLVRVACTRPGCRWSLQTYCSEDLANGWATERSEWHDAEVHP